MLPGIDTVLTDIQSVHLLSANIGIALESEFPH